MADNCWQPEVKKAPNWGAAGCTGAQWEQQPEDPEGSTSVACLAIACLAIACSSGAFPPYQYDVAGDSCVDTLGSATDVGFDNGFA